MTDSLRDALRDAAEGPRPGSGVSGRDLLWRGRRRARFRRASGTAAGALVLVAAAGIPLAPGMLSELGDGPGTPSDVQSSGPAKTEPTIAAAGSRVRSLDQLEGFCANIEDYEDWTVGAGVYEKNHSTAILVSPDGERWAECGGSRSSAVLTTGMQIEEDPGYNWMRVLLWWDGCVTGADPQVCVWAAAGQPPPGVARMIFKQADGRTTEADVRNGFFAWQSQVESIDVFNQPLWVTLYHADGAQIDRINFNRNPDTW